MGSFADVNTEVEVEPLKGKALLIGMIYTSDNCMRPARAINMSALFHIVWLCSARGSVRMIKHTNYVFFSGLHHGIIPTAVLVAVLIFALLAGATWFAYKRNALCFQGLPTFGSAYYRQTSTQSTESDGNVLITDLGSHSGQ